MLLTDDEIKAIDPDGLAEGFARAIESAVLEKLKAQEPVAYMVQHDGKCMGFLPTSEKNTVPVFTNPLPQDDVVRDAERYRWLREKAAPQWRNGPGLYWYLPRFMDGTPQEKLDAAIDAAMEKMK